MLSAEEMRGLAQEIVASKRGRKEAIASMQAGVKSQLVGYRSEHQTMAEEVRKELTEDAKARQMGMRIQLTGFRNDHQAMAEEMRAELAKVTKALKKDVRSQLRGYGAEMKEVRAELVAARRAWQQGLKGAPPKPKPRAQKKAPAKKPTE